jgi:hypothetical protein
VEQTGLLEDVIRELSADDQGWVELDVKPFEIVTLKFTVSQ